MSRWVALMVGGPADGQTLAVGATPSGDPLTTIGVWTGPAVPTSTRPVESGVAPKAVTYILQRFSWSAGEAVYVPLGTS